MRSTAILTMAAASAAWPVIPAASAAELHARSYEPSSQWVLDFADERCTLARNFGSGDETLLLRIDSFGNWNNFHLTVVGKAVPYPRTPAGAGSYRLTGDAESRDARLLFGTLGKDRLPAASLEMQFRPLIQPGDWQKLSDKEKAAYRVRLGHSMPEFDRSVDTIKIAFGRGALVELHLGNMAEPLVAMRACIADLYKSWGMDPEVENQLSRVAEPLPSTVKQVKARYPGGALLQGLSAFVPVRLLVDADGEATSCIVQAPEAGADFKRAVCDNLAGKFKPALDASGHPVASMYHTSVVYLIGGHG